MARRRKAEMSFEINLLPMIDILSVCISFLLFSTVWLHIGTFNTRQALGTDGAETAKNPPSMWVQFQANGTIEVLLKDAKKAPRNLDRQVFSSRNGHVDTQGLEQYAAQLKSQVPELDMALVMPQAASPYEDVVAVMDSLRKKDVKQIGISPL
jgi:biopolymer transport protein ExbD